MGWQKGICISLKRSGIEIDGLWGAVWKLLKIKGGRERGERRGLEVIENKEEGSGASEDRRTDMKESALRTAELEANHLRTFFMNGGSGG